VFVIVEPARIPYVVVVPGRIVGPAAEEIADPNNTGTATTATGIPHKSRDTLAENFFFICAGYA
jgi:hypothetical protein